MKYGETFDALYDKIITRMLEDGIPAPKPAGSRYPEWWNKTITLFNKYTDMQEKKTVWYRFVIANVFFKNTASETLSGNNVYYADNFVVRIPKNSRYMPYAEWEKLDSNEKEKYFTVSTGDLILLGSVETDINENIPGQRSNDVLKNFKPNAFFIKTFSDNSGNVGLEHYRIGGN